MKKLIISIALTASILLSCTSDDISERRAECFISVSTDASREAEQAAEMIKNTLEEFGFAASDTGGARDRLTVMLAARELPIGGYSIVCRGGHITVRAQNADSMLAAAEQLIYDMSQERKQIFASDHEYSGTADGYEIFSCLPPCASAEAVTAEVKSGKLRFSGISKEDMMSYIGSLESDALTLTASGSLGGSLFYILEGRSHTVHAAYFAGEARAEITVSNSHSSLTAVYDAGNDCAPLLTVVPCDDAQVLIVRLRDGSFLICGDARDESIYEMIIEQSPKEKEAVIALWLTQNEPTELYDSVDILCTCEPHSFGIPISLNGGSVTCLYDGAFEIKLDGAGSYLFAASSSAKAADYGELPCYCAAIAISAMSVPADISIFRGSGISTEREIYLGGKRAVFTLPIGIGSAYTILPVGDTRCDDISRTAPQARAVSPLRALSDH